MALEYNAVFSRITKLISIKKDISRSLIINFIPMKISFCFLQQMLICVLGWQTQTFGINMYVYEKVKQHILEQKKQ